MQAQDDMVDDQQQPPSLDNSDQNSTEVNDENAQGTNEGSQSKEDTADYIAQNVGNKHQ